MQLERTVRNGLPVWWVQTPGEFTAALYLRVGTADEALPIAGITHLVEHLVMAAVGRREHGHNALVDETTCVFYADGDRAEVLEFLTLVGRAIATVDLSRLEHERRVLRAEAAQRDPGVVARLLELRYGVQGYGLGNDAELGLRWVGEPEVRAWWARHFTRGNAAVWMSGEPPEDLGFELPDGPRVPLPEGDPLPHALPAFIDGGTGGVALSGVGERSTALTLALTVAEERLGERLRHGHGVSYSTFADYRPIGKRRAHLMLGSDGRDEDAELLLAELWTCMGELAERGATTDELDRARRSIERGRRDPQALLGDLAFAVDCELTGVPHLSEAELDAERAHVDGPAVAAALREVLDGALLLGPEGSQPIAGVPELPVPDPEPLEGERFRPARSGLLRRRGDAELVIGERGLCFRTGDERLAIDWPEVAAVERWPSGEQRVIAIDGRWVGIAPFHWDDGARAVSLLHARVPSDRIVPAAEASLCSALEETVARRIENVAPVAPPLDALPELLGTDERVVDLAAATRNKGFVVGLLAVTERRVLWLATLSDDRLTFSRGAVKASASGGELRLDDTKFIITPKRAAQELAALI